ncbi:hypothetical protein EV177_009584, partial [Coemansia sp. RSA 1804]
GSTSTRTICHCAQEDWRQQDSSTTSLCQGSSGHTGGCRCAAGDWHPPRGQEPVGAARC